MLGEGFTVGQEVKLTVLPGYPRSAQNGELKAYDKTRRWSALFMVLSLPCLVMTLTTSTSSRSATSLYEFLGNSFLFNLPWFVTVAVVLFSFIIAFVLFKNWMTEVHTATLHRGHDLDYVVPQRIPFQVGIRLTHDSGPISYPYLAEAMVFAVAFAALTLAWCWMASLFPLVCLYCAVYFTWRDYFTNKKYFTSGVMTVAVVTESKSKRCNAIAYTYNKKHYKIYEAKTKDPDYHLGEQVQVLVIPNDPTSARLVCVLEKEKTVWGRLFCHTLPLLVWGRFAFHMSQLRSEDAALISTNPIAFTFAILFQFVAAFALAHHWWHSTTQKSLVMEVLVSEQDANVASESVIV